MSKESWKKEWSAHRGLRGGGETANKVTRALDDQLAKRAGCPNLKTRIKLAKQERELAKL